MHFFKRNLFRISFLLAYSLLFDGCKKEDVSEVILEYQIPLVDNMEIDTLNVGELIIRESYDFPTSLDGELAKNNTSKEKIKSARLVFMRLQVMDYALYDSARYSNLKDISELMADIKKDGVGQDRVAHKLLPDTRVKAVNMDLDDVELSEYLKQDNFRMVFKYRKRRAMPHEMPFVITLRFRIVADPL